MPLALNTADPLYASLSRLFCVDDDNIIKELKGGLTLTRHANVKTPDNGSTSAPFGRSFRTTGDGAGAAQGIDFPAFAASNAGAVSVFIAANQYNGGSQPAGDYGAMLFGADGAGLKIGTGLQIELASGKFSPHNNNGGIGNPTLIKTAGSITTGAKSFGFTRNGLANVFAYIDGALDANFASGVSNAGSGFGANWGTSECGFIGGFGIGSSWVSFDLVYVAVFVGAELSPADFSRLHASLTGGNRFALLEEPPASITGTAALDDVVPTGTMDGPGASNLAGSAQLDGVASSGTLGTAPGTINLANWKNAAGDVLPSQLVPLLSFLRLSDGAQVLTLSNQITSANPVAPALSITHANLVPGAWYMACAWNADGSIAGIEPYQAA